MSQTMVIVVKGKEKIKQGILPLFLVLSIVMAWVLINGESVIPAKIWNRAWIETYIIFFTIMTIAFILWVIAENRGDLVKQLFQYSLLWSVPAIAVGTSITMFCMWFMYEVIMGLQAVWFNWGQILGLILFFGFIVAPIERMTFSYYLYNIAGKWSASIWFGFFHLAVSGFNWGYFIAMIFFNLLLLELYELRGQGKETGYTIMGLPMLISIHATFDIMTFLYWGLLG